MYNSTFTPYDSVQNRATVLVPGIVGLFLQGLETGLVIAQFCRWFFSTERKDSATISTLVIFVTSVGLAQSGIYLASTWRKYVLGFGRPIEGPDWTDYTQPIPTMAIVVPVQVLMICRCYRTVKKNMYIIAPLVLLLTISIVTTIWMIVKTLQFEFTAAAQSYLHLPEAVGISYPYLTSLLAPSVLDVALTSILLHRLTRAKKQVYATHIHQQISHIMTVVWQSAIPPTLCTILMCVLYIQFATARKKKLEFWYTVIQGLIGKLYVLSLFYIIDYGPTTSERPSTFISTVVVTIEGWDGLSGDSGIASCHRCPSVYESAMSGNAAV